VHTYLGIAIPSFLECNGNNGGTVLD